MQTLRAKFHTVLRANCVGFGGKTRTSFRENNEKKQLLHLRGLPRTRSSGLSRRFPLEMFFTQGSAESPRRLPPVLLHLFFFFLRARTRAQASAHICAYLRANIHANFARLFRAQHLRATLREPLRDPQRKVYASLYRNFHRNFRGQLLARTSANACAQTSRQTLTPMSAGTLTPNYSMFRGNFHAHSKRTCTQFYCGRFGANLEAGAPEAPFFANCDASFRAIYHVVSRKIFRRNSRALFHVSFYVVCYVDWYAKFHASFRAKFRRNLPRKLPTALSRNLPRAVIRVFIRIPLLELRR